MKYKRFSAYLLALLLMLQCVPVSAAAEQGTQLYYQTAPTSLSQAQQIWPSNSSTGINSDIVMDDGSGTVRTFGYYNNRNSAGVGLPEGEYLELTIPNLSLKTAAYDEMELSFRYAQCDTGDEINVGMVDDLRLYASTDGGKTWSSKYAKLKDNVLVGIGNVGDGESHVYDIYTTDIAGLVEEGQVINALKLKPFGNHPEHYGFFRVAEIKITGYSGKAPVRTPKAEMITVDADILRQVAVEQFYKQCTLPWVPAQKLVTYNGATIEERTQYYLPGYLYLGPPYSRPARSTWERFFNSVTSTGDLTADYVYTNEDCQGGLDCIYTVWDGLALVTPAHANSWTYILKEKNNSVRMVGGLQERTKIYGSRTPAEVLAQFTVQEVYEALADLKVGDMLLNGHAQMVTGEPVVVRKEDGTIDGNRSYLKITDTAGRIAYHYMKPDGSIVVSTTKDVDEYLAAHPDFTYLYGSSMRIDQEQTFRECYDESYQPATLKEYHDGRIPKQQLKVLTNVTAENLVENGFYAAVQSNWRMVQNKFTLIDRESGKAVFTFAQFPKVHYEFDWVNRVTCAELDEVLKTLSAGSYTLMLDVQSGPVVKVGGEPPMNRVFSLDFNV